MVMTDTSPACSEPLSWSRSEVDQLDQPGVDVVLLNRTPSWAVDELDSALMRGKVDVVRSVAGPDDLEQFIRQALADLELADQTEVADDMARVGTSFMAQFQCPQVRIRIDLADRQGCPKFHCDCVKLRLVTTYAGPSTEYRQQADESDIQTFGVATLGILKGCRHETHQGENLLHRSPLMEAGQRRLSLVLDI